MADNSLGLFLNDASTMTWFLEYGRHTDLNLDLTQYTEVDGGDPEFHFNLFSDHSGATLNIKLTTAGGGFSTYNINLPTQETRNYDISIYDFVGSANLSDIDNISFTFTTTVQSTDLIFSGLLTLGSVPEPHTAVMLLMAGGIIRVLRRRKFQAVHG